MLKQNFPAEEAKQCEDEIKDENANRKALAEKADVIARVVITEKDETEKAKQAETAAKLADVWAEKGVSDVKEEVEKMKTKAESKTSTTELEPLIY